MTSGTTDIETMHDLQSRLLELKRNAKQQKEDLVSAVKDFKLTLAPKNLGKQMIKAVITGSEHNKLISGSLSLATGLIGKKILFGKPKGIFGNLLGNGVEIFLTRIISRSVHFNRLINKIPNTSQRFNRTNRDIPQ